MSRSIVLLFALLWSGAALAQERSFATRSSTRCRCAISSCSATDCSRSSRKTAGAGDRGVGVRPPSRRLQHVLEVELDQPQSVHRDADQREQGSTILADPRYQLRDSVFLIDGETIGSLSACAAASADMSRSASRSRSRRWEAAGPTPIESVHNTLRIGNAERDAFARNVETVYVRTPGVTYCATGPPVYELGDVAISAKVRVGASRTRSSPRLSPARSTAHRQCRHAGRPGSLDAGARLIVSHDLGGGRLNASFGVIHLGRNAASRSSRRPSSPTPSVTRTAFRIARLSSCSSPFPRRRSASTLPGTEPPAPTSSASAARTPRGTTPSTSPSSRTSSPSRTAPTPGLQWDLAEV